MTSPQYIPKYPSVFIQFFEDVNTSPSPVISRRPISTGAHHSIYSIVKKTVKPGETHLFSATYRTEIIPIYKDRRGTTIPRDPKISGLFLPQNQAPSLW